MAPMTEAVGLAFLGTSLVLLVLLREPLRHPENPGSKGFALAVVGISLWPLSLGVNYLLPGFEASSAVWNVRLFASSLISVGWFLLAVNVTSGRPLSRRFVAPFVGYMVVEQALAWTNSYHHLVLGPGTTVSGTFLQTELGPWFWTQAAINYGLILGGTALFAAEWMRSTGLRRRQAAVLSLAVVPPTVANLVTIFGFVSTPYDLTPVGLIGSGLLLSWALYRAEFLDLVPIARQAAMAEMHDAVVTLDGEDRIVDCNQAARELFDAPDEYVGVPANAFFDPVLTGVVERVDESADVDTEVSTTLHGREHHFSVSISTVDQGDETAGRVFVLRDITPIKRRERALEAREAELDLLRQVLSRVLRHNIRNELTTIRGNGELLAEQVDEPLDGQVAAIVDASESLIAITEKVREVEGILDQTDEVEQYDLRLVAEQVVDSCRERYPSVSFTVDGPDECRLTAGPGLETAVENLVENAAAYNDAERPHVWLAIERNFDGPRLTVADDGPGIPAEEIDVLEREAESPLSHGSGIGLWLVKWVADRSEAELEFEMDDDGTAVSLRFDSAVLSAR